jgi:hypothetical protein
MTKYRSSWEDFYSDFKDNPIKPYNKDVQWSDRLGNMNQIIINSEDLIDQNKLKEAHTELEKIRQKWQDTFLINNVTMLGFYMTEYHDIMEKAIEQSNNNDFETLKVTCESMHASWGNVVGTEVNFKDMDDFNVKVKAVTDNLNNFCTSVEQKDENGLKEYSSKLKPTFIAIYLKYG